MTREPAWAAAPEGAPCAEWAAALIEARQTVLPKRLAAPGPEGPRLELILSAAAAAPDHGECRPWRFVLVPPAARDRLAQAFAQALLERDALATPQQVDQAREKAHRAPVLLLAIACLGTASASGEEIPADERLVSAGCAIQNMLLAATAQGFASALTSGKALQSAPLRALFGLQADERALCFLNFGTATARRPRRARPQPETFVSALDGVA